MSSKVERFINYVAEDMASQTEYKTDAGWDDYIIFHFTPFGGEEMGLIKHFYSKYNLFECYNKIHNDSFYNSLKRELNREVRQSTIIISITTVKNYILNTYGLSLSSDKDIINSIWTTFYDRLMEMYGNRGESLTEGAGGEINMEKKSFYRDYIIQRIISNTEWDLFSNEISFPFEFNYSLGHFLIHPESIDGGPYHPFTTYVMDHFSVTEDFATDVYLEFKTEMIDYIKNTLPTGGFDY